MNKRGSTIANMGTNKILMLVAVILFVIAAVVANGTKIVVAADVWAYAGLAFFAAGHLV
jgi:hypothetical protein